MKKWEYLCVYHPRTVSVSIFDLLGNQGWELITALQLDGCNYRYIFKREKI